MADEELKDDRTIKHKTKDSVFSRLFSQPENILELYKELHPEDTETTVEDIQLETLETVFINDIYNDLGFIVKHGEKSKYILLVEAQSKWTENITLRMLFYITETYRRYLKSTKQSEHITRRVYLPKPEFYVVYTGGKDVPEEVSLNQTYFDGTAPLDIRVKVLTQTGTETIYGQYIGFSKVYDEQRKLYGNKVQCIEETIRICFENGYLAGFLNIHKEEVFGMLSELFDEEALREQYDAAMAAQSEARGRKIGEAIGEARGKAIGEANGIIKTLVGLVKDGILNVSDAAKRADMTVAEFEAKTGLKTT